MRARILITLCFLLLGAGSAAAEVELKVDSEFQWLRGMKSSTTLRLIDERAQPLRGHSATISIDGEWYDQQGSLEGRVLDFTADGSCVLTDIEVRSGSGSFVLELDDGTRLAASTRPVHPAWPLLPALLAIVIALTIRQVLLALSLGVFAGAWILAGGPLDAFQMALKDIVVPAVSDPFRAAILLFTGALGGMVAVMARAGGTAKYPFGDSKDSLCEYGNGADRSTGSGFDRKNTSCSDGYVETAPAGSFKPNAFGVYDTVGNVWEWVEDCRQIGRAHV